MKDGFALGMKRLLRGTGDDRLRASWRILIAFTLTFGGALAGVVVIQRTDVPELFTPLVGHAFAVTGVLVALGVLARYVDRRRPAEYGFSLSGRWILDALGGTLVGIALVGIAFVLSYERGAVDVVEVLSAGSAHSFVSGVGIVVLGWIFVGIWEETLLRSLFFKNAAEGLSARGLSQSGAVVGAWLSSSLVYGFLHGPLGSNPESVPLLYALVMTSVMGGLFGLAYALSGELAVPIGLHTGINFAEHNLFFGPPEAVAPAVLRVEHAVSGGHVQFQSIEPVVILPVFLAGYMLITGWFYLRRGALSCAVLNRRTTSG